MYLVFEYKSSVKAIERQTRRPHYYLVEGTGVVIPTKASEGF